MAKEEALHNRAMKPRKKSLKDEILRFAMLSSVRGLSRILRSRSPAWKLFWLVFISSSLSIAISLSMNVIRNYRSFDTMQELREHLNYPLPFPSVTVCNSQAIDKDRYESLNPQLVKGLFQKLASLRQLYGSSESLLEDRFFLFENLGRNLSNQVGFSKRTLFLEDACTFTYLNTSTGKDYYSPCFENDVRLIQTPRYFNCFMLTPDPSIISHATDLKIDLFLNVPGLLENRNFSHLPYNEDDTTGARVSIHSPLSWPYSEEVGIDIEPGTKTMIDLAPSKLMFHPHKGDKACSEDLPQYRTLRAHTEEGKASFAYTRKFCTDLQLQNMTLERCKCVDPRKPHPPGLRDENFCGKIPADANLALNFTLEQLRCADNIELDSNITAVSLSRASSCPMSCQTLQYKYQTSQSLWPTKNKEVEFYQRVLQKIPSLRKKYIIYEKIHNLSQYDTRRSRQLLLKEDRIRTNFARLHIFRTDFSASERQMILKTTAESMVSQIGGIFHLLTGITFACVIELLECVYYVTKKALSPRHDGAMRVAMADPLESQPLPSRRARPLDGVAGDDVAAELRRRMETAGP